MELSKDRIWSIIKQLAKAFYQHFIVFPYYILTHPIDGFYEMKRYQRGLLRVSTFYIVIEATMSILQYRYSGFMFNNFNPATFNYIRQILTTFSPYAAFIIANWAITTLMDGKGSFKDIYNVVGYALFLKVILSLINIPLSHVFTNDEAFFYYGIETFGYVVMIFLLFMGMMTVHEYTLGKAVLTLILTLVVIGILVFLGLLIFSLIQQIVIFIITVYREIVLRL
jgi:hypothetical protein